MFGSYCTKIPDRDNLEKMVSDAINKTGIWEDDSQVCGGEVKKIWHEKSETIVSIKRAKPRKILLDWHE